MRDATGGFAGSSVTIAAPRVVGAVVAVGLRRNAAVEAAPEPPARRPATHGGG